MKVYHRGKKIVYEKPSIEKRLRYLRWEVLRAEYEYYCLSDGTSRLRYTDEQFDQMFRKLVELETEFAGGEESMIPADSPAVIVGSSSPKDYPWHVRFGRPPWHTPQIQRSYVRSSGKIQYRVVSDGS